MRTFEQSGYEDYMLSAHDNLNKMMSEKYNICIGINNARIMFLGRKKVEFDIHEDIFELEQPTDKRIESS